MGWFSNNNSKDSEEFNARVKEVADKIVDGKEKQSHERYERKTKADEDKAVKSIKKLDKLFPTLDKGFYNKCYPRYSETTVMPTGLRLALAYLEYQYINSTNFSGFCSSIKPISTLYSLEDYIMDWDSVIYRVKNSSEYSLYKTKRSIYLGRDEEDMIVNDECILSMLKDHNVLADLHLLKNIKDGTIVELTEEDFLDSVYLATANMFLGVIKPINPNKITELYKLLIFEGNDFYFEQVKSDLIEQFCNSLDNKNIKNIKNTKNNKCDNSCCNCNNQKGRTNDKDN